MKHNLLLFCTFLITEYWVLNTAKSKDLATHGHTFKIQEPDLLKQIEGKLHHLKTRGKLAELNEGIIKKTQKAIHTPHPVAGIVKATKPRVFYYDPSISIPYDLRDQTGRIFQKAGTKINPLKFRSLPSPLIFIDGNDETQVSWVHKTYLSTNQGKDQRRANENIPTPPKIILISGSPFELMERWNQLAGSQLIGTPLVGHPVYFDQGGKLTKKLGIQHVPAVVTQENLRLRIEEVCLHAQKKKRQEEEPL